MEQYIKIAIYAISILSTVITIIILLMKNSKNKKLVEIANAYEEITSLIQEKIKEQEKMFINISTLLKTNKISVGEIKKENVMTFIERKCIEKKITFDEEYWSTKIEELVSLINVNKKEGENKNELLFR